MHISICMEHIVSFAVEMLFHLFGIEVSLYSYANSMIDFLIIKIWSVVDNWI